MRRTGRWFRRPAGGAGGGVPAARHPDGGAATVLMVGIVASAAALAGTVLAVGDVVAERHRVEAVADVAALAAAGTTGDDSCGRAVQVAVERKAAVVSCRRGVDGSVSVVVRSSPRIGPGAVVDVTGRARAGRPRQSFP